MYLYEYKVKFTKYILIYCIALKDAWCVIAVNWLRSRSFVHFTITISIYIKEREYSRT